MAQIFVRTGTHEKFKAGHWELRIIAGLDENPDLIMKEAQERVASSIEVIPEEKRYSRDGADGFITELE